MHIASQKLTAFHSITVNALERIIRILGDKGPVIDIESSYMLGLPKDSRLVYEFHQESSFYRNFDAFFNTHYPIFRRSTTINGTMSVLSGSHRLGDLSYTKNRKASNSYTDLIPKDINNIISKYDEVHLELDLGDCAIFHKDLIHKSNFNSSNLCRPVAVGRLTQDVSGDLIVKTSDEH